MSPVSDQALACGSRTARTFQLAFPHDLHPPAERREFLGLAHVAPAVLREFRQPVVLPRRGRLPGAAVVAMPETAMHEDREPTTGQDKVRRSGQVAPVKTKSRAPCKERPSQDHLGARVALTDGAHEARATGIGGLGRWSHFPSMPSLSFAKASE